MAQKKGVTPSKNALPAWFWMLFGSGLTLGVLLFVYLLNPFERSAQSPTELEVTSNQPAEQEVVQEQELEFYDVLPEQSVQLIPEPELELTEEEPVTSESSLEEELTGQDTAEQSESSALIESPKIYRLNLGNFETASDADRRRAQVLMMGLEDASVVQSQTPMGVVYTLVSSAYPSRSKAANAQQRLRDSGFESVITAEDKPQPPAAEY